MTQFSAEPQYCGSGHGPTSNDFNLTELPSCVHAVSAHPLQIHCKMHSTRLNDYHLSFTEAFSASFNCLLSISFFQ